jgi:hypothetical protein
MKWDSLSRRHLLQGLGASLVLPALPSLLSPRLARAAGPDVQKTFVGIMAFNGLYRMYGPDSQLMPATPFDYSTYSAQGFMPVNVPGRYPIHAKPLSTLANQNGGKISDIVDASFTPYLSKMLMLQGFDYFSLGYFHHHGHFGNSAASAGDSGNPAMASIDQVMAYSNSFYKNPLLRGRSVSWTANSSEGTSGYEGSFTFQNPADMAGSAIVSNRPVYSNPAALWDAFMGTATQAPPLKKTVVDRVLADYRSLRTRNTRLGAEDRRRLDQHIELLQETQRRVNAVTAVCSQLRPDSNLSDRKLILNTMNNVIVSLIACGLCHSFLGWAQSLVSSNPEDYHRWSHEGYDNDTNLIGNPTSYASLVEHNRSIMKEMCLDLATKLDANGLLDSTLIACVQEHNKRGHESWNVPIIAFGSAGGLLRTGQYLDYRDMSQRDDRVYSRFGYPINQFLANALVASGVPREEFEPLNKAPNSLFKPYSGYGVSRFNPQPGMDVFSDHMQNWNGVDLTDWLPGIKA